MNSPHIYVITTEGDEEGRTQRVLGYATGKPEHIRAYYDDQKMYKLELREAAVLDIIPETVLAKKGLTGQKIDLEQKLHRIERELRALEGEAA